jgi:RNA polymerase sigma factor (sigma-70 family)
VQAVSSAGPGEGELRQHARDAGEPGLTEPRPASRDGLLGDRELWQRARDGDGEAFGQLFDRHATPVYNHLFRRTANWSEAEDLTSAVFLQAWRSRGQVVIDRESVLPWLLGVANQVLRNSRRAARRYRDALARIPRVPEPAHDHAEAVASAVDDQRRMAELQQAVSRLPRPEREVIELCAWSGLDHKGAAVALGVPVGTVKSRMHRARRRLAASLGAAAAGQHDPDPGASRGPAEEAG